MPPRAHGTWLTPRRERLLVAAIVLLGFALRVAHVLAMRASPLFDAPVLDVLYHVEWARAFASGERFQEGPFFRAPLYPWFLGVLFRLFGDGLLLPRLVQCALGAASVLLVHLVARRAFDAATGLLAALLAATYWVLIYYDAELLIPALLVPLELLALWLVLGVELGRPGRRAAGAGLVFGLAAIARPNVLLFVPLLALWIALRAREGLRAGCARGALFAAGLLLPILPVTAFNYFIGGDLVLVSSQAGVNLWIGNHPGSDGTTAIVPGARPGWWEGHRDSIAMAAAAEGRELLPSEVSRHYARKTWASVAERPGAALGHLFFKLRLFWTDWELGNNQEIRFFAYRFDPLLRWLPLGFGLLAPLGLLGLALAWREWRRLFPLWGFLVVYTLSVVAFFVCARFRVPVLPLLAVFAAHALLWLGGCARRRRFGRGALALALVGLGSWGMRTLPELPAIRSSEATGYMQLGLAEPRPELAIGYLERAAELNPANVAARLRLAQLRAGRGELARAASASLALWRETGAPLALELYAELLLARRRAGELQAEQAARELESVLGSAAAGARDPLFAALAQLWVEAGERERALAAARRWVQASPGSDRARRLLESLEGA